jgi:hypothetical protein
MFDADRWLDLNGADIARGQWVRDQERLVEEMQQR